MNARNAVWNLMLDRPYNDGGHEHSGRVSTVGHNDFWDVKRQKTAARVIEGGITSRVDDSQSRWGSQY